MDNQTPRLIKALGISSAFLGISLLTGCRSGSIAETSKTPNVGLESLATDGQLQNGSGMILLVKPVGLDGSGLEKYQGEFYLQTVELHAAGNIQIIVNGNGLTSVVWPNGSTTPAIVGVNGGSDTIDFQCESQIKGWTGGCNFTVPQTLVNNAVGSVDLSGLFISQRGGHLY